MKRIVLLFALAFALGMPAAAQYSGGGGSMNADDMVKTRLASMTTEMMLTTDEQTQVEAVLKESVAKMQQLRQQNSGGDRQAMRSALQGVRTEQNQKIAAIVGQERFDAYQKKMEAQRANRPGGKRPGANRPGGGGGPRP